MSTMDVTFNLPQAGSLPAHAPVREVRSELGPWGFWGSLGWGLFAVATSIVAVFIYMIIWTLMTSAPSLLILRTCPSPRWPVSRL